MRSLLITNDFPPYWGGAAQVCYNIWKNLAPENIIVLAPYLPGCEEIDRTLGFKVYRAKIFCYSTFLGKLIKPFIFLFYTRSIIKKHQDIELIYCGNVLTTFLPGMFAFKFHKIPYFAHLFVDDLQAYGRVRIIRDFFMKFLNNAKRIIIACDFTRDLFISKGVRKELFRTVYPGVDMDTFYPMDAIRVKEGLNLSGKKVILSVCRLVERKGMDMLIKSLPLVLEKVPDVVLIICGAGKLEKKLKKLASKYKLEESVYFPGHKTRRELALYYNACDVFVMPSRVHKGLDAEGFGIVFLEAGACAKPVIGGRSGGIPEAIVDGQTGFLVDPLDVEDIANKIIKILTDDNLARQLGEKARMRIREKFQWKISARTLQDIMEED
jgi:phosphatidylinositol alpha-1,6-mannosyltransferase